MCIYLFAERAKEEEVEELSDPDVRVTKLFRVHCLLVFAVILVVNVLHIHVIVSTLPLVGLKRKFSFARVFRLLLHIKVKIIINTCNLHVWTVDIT